ncbi:MAG: hypothetical protein ACTSQI_18210 [Candidatus Helarchaeota archaeon]
MQNRNALKKFLSTNHLSPNPFWTLTPYRCPEKLCDYNTSSSAVLKKYIKNGSHSRKKPYICGNYKREFHKLKLFRLNKTWCKFYILKKDGRIK